MPTRLTIRVFSLLLALAVTACATVKTQSPSEKHAVPAPENRVDARSPSAEPTPISTPPQEHLSPEQRKTQEVIAQMQESYGLGLEAHQAGHYGQARDYFNQAVEAALDSGLRIDAQPHLRRVYEEILENIEVLEEELLSSSAEAHDQPPKEELRDITSYLSAEEAEKEREKVESAVRAVKYDIPVELNDKVLTFIEAFQTRLRKPFEGGLRRSGLYLDMIKEIFREEGLPTDLAYMAHQESAYKTNAYSRAHAKGLWQFIAPTARKYGLRRDAWVDERSDPEKATRAAAAYLKDLYALFGDWYLAMAAYNAGEGRVGRALKRTGTSDFWSLTKHRRALRRETRNYVPAILASIVIDKAPEEYGFEVDLEDPLRVDRVTIEDPTDLKVIAKCAGTTVQEIKRLNPELRTMATPPYSHGYELKVPHGTGDAFLVAYAQVPKDQRLQWTKHQVKKGETLSLIARRYGVQMSAVRSANSIRNPHRLRVGQTLIIPKSGYVAASRSNTYLKYDKGTQLTHRVRRGDTLHRIALKYRTNVKSLQQWNNLSGSMIKPGQRLVVYYATRNRGEGDDGSEAKYASATGQYRVKKGDTLYDIAQRHGMSVNQLRSLNNLGRGGKLIHPGQTLRVSSPLATPPSLASAPSKPGASTDVIHYRIRRGDTLDRIARRHGVPVRDLMRWNGLVSPHRITAGKVLEIHAN